MFSDERWYNADEETSKPASGQFHSTVHFHLASHTTVRCIGPLIHESTSVFVVIVSAAFIMYSRQAETEAVQSLRLSMIASLQAAEWYTRRFPSVD